MKVLACLFPLLLGACRAPSPTLTVAAAANLTGVFDQVGREFTATTGVPVVFSYGSTAQLATQIENGAPFDVFAAADVEHVDSLVAAKRLESRVVYALGQLVLWSPKGAVGELKDLARPEIRYVAIAQPELAPYGKAAVEALKTAHLWDQVQLKVVYGTNISQAKQLALSGNADAAFTAYSLVLHEQGTVTKVDGKLEQGLGVVAGSARAAEARKFRAFLLGPKGRTVLGRNGYLLP